MFCDKCGNKVKDTMGCCPYCGNKFQEETVRKKSFVFPRVHKRIVFGVAVCLGIVFIGAGVFGTAQRFGKKENEPDIQTEVTGQNEKNKGNATSGKSTKWKLFQKKENTFLLKKEEKEWVYVQLEELAKRNNKVQWEEGFLTFKVLGQAEKKENTISLDVMCCAHPVGYKKYTNQIQFIKVAFDCQQEPIFDQIQFKICDSMENNFTKAKASSVCASQRNMVSAAKGCSYYEAKNVVDDEKDTAWIEGKKGYGKGEWISLSAEAEQTVCGIAIQNGFIKSDRTLERNAQVKKVTLTFSDGTKQSYELQKNKYETGGEEWYSDCIIFDKPIDTKKVKFTIETVYQGKKFYQYWEQGNGYKAKYGEKCEDTCISEIKVLTMPASGEYTALSPEKRQEEETHYNNWKQAYQDAVEQRENLMDRYNENMKLYVEQYEAFHGTKEARYDENGKLYLPEHGFLQDINGDSIPELFLVSSTERENGEFLGNYAECVVHVFSYDVKEKQRLYCGSFVTRYDDQVGEKTYFYQDDRDGSLRTLLCLAAEECTGGMYHHFWSVNHGKLICKKVLQSGQTIKEDDSSIMVRWYKKDGISVSKQAYDREQQEDNVNMTEIELLGLGKLEEELKKNISVDSGEKNEVSLDTRQEVKIQDVLEKYDEYIRTESDIKYDSYSICTGYSLIYIDEDDIPELVIHGESEAAGNIVCNYYNGKVRATHLERLHFYYMPRKNLLCNAGGLMDCYFDRVYKIKNGKMIQITEGEYGAEDNTKVQYDKEGWPIYQYNWEGKRVTEKEYKKALKRVYSGKGERESDDLKRYTSVYKAYDGLMDN